MPNDLRFSSKKQWKGYCDGHMWYNNFHTFLIGPMIAASLITYFGGMSVSGIRPLFYFQLVGLVLSLFLINSRFSNPLRSESSGEFHIMDSIKRILSGNKSMTSWIILYMLSNFPYYAAFLHSSFCSWSKRRARLW